MPAPTTTRAIRIERTGPPDALVDRERPLDPVGPGEVRLRVEAAGVNFADLMMRVGLYGSAPPRPFSPGFEVAGVVEETGDGVETWAEGDRAVALLRFGGYARHVVIAAEQIFPCPAGLSAVEAASVPVVFLTAWVCLFEAARVREGELALILGASGGVGTAATQLALDAGLRVIGTAGSPGKRAFVEALGAEACFDARGDWPASVRAHAGPNAVDVALDPVGGDATRACIEALAPLGRLVFYGLSQALPGVRRNPVRAMRAYLRTPRLRPTALVEPNIGIFGVHLLHLGARERAVLPGALSTVFAKIESGALRPVIDTVYDLDAAGAAAAHERLHARRNIGKVLLATADARAEHGART